jgi:class 3 adenylate cyclase
MEQSTLSRCPPCGPGKPFLAPNALVGCRAGQAILVLLHGVWARAVSETRKIAAILVADVVGYSRLAGADEDRTRRVATRYDRNAANFLAAVCIAATVSFWL